MENKSRRPHGKTIYFDCYGGISGDMALGALVDCGVKLEDLKTMLTLLNLPGYDLDAQKVSLYGISGTKVSVRLHREDCGARRLSDITALINKSTLPDRVKRDSGAVFSLLAEAEAAVHGTSVEKVHFHEVGAVDAIVDIVGTAVALYLLGVDEIICSPLPLGRGEVKTAHGTLPLPAPAVVELLSRRNVPVYGCEILHESVTPTGAAIVAALAKRFGCLPSFTIEKNGCGSGTYDPGYPNYLRVLYGSPGEDCSRKAEQVAVIETNIDDLNPEVYSYLMEQLFQEGALDVYYAPVQMKKNRPAVHLTVLADPECSGRLEQILFRETSTLGVRRTVVDRVVRSRQVETVQTPWGPVRVKVAFDMDRDRAVNIAPEYEDCRVAAIKSGLPLREIYRQVDLLCRRGGCDNTFKRTDN